MMSVVESRKRQSAFSFKVAKQYLGGLLLAACTRTASEARGSLRKLADHFGSSRTTSEAGVIYADRTPSEAGATQFLNVFGYEIVSSISI